LSFVSRRLRVASAKLSLGEGLLEKTFAELRRCGGGCRECVVYWSGPLAELAQLDRCLHPRHTATARFYEVEQGWLDQTWRTLARERREIRVQVHTHGAVAFHSATDDRFPIVQTPGFLSLVLPGFALGDINFDGAYLARMRSDGGWEELEPAEVFEVTR
jgi:hypothetical protein